MDNLVNICRRVSFNTSMADTQLKKRKMSLSEDTPLGPVSELLVKRVSDKGKLPTRGSPLAGRGVRFVQVRVK